MRFPPDFARFMEPSEEFNPGPCECGARWYRTTAGRIRIDHDLDKHRALPHPENRPTEPTFAEQREALKLMPSSPLPYPDD